MWGVHHMEPKGSRSDFLGVVHMVSINVGIGDQPYRYRELQIQKLRPSRCRRRDMELNELLEWEKTVGVNWLSKQWRVLESHLNLGIPYYEPTNGHALIA